MFDLKEFKAEFALDLKCFKEYVKQNYFLFIIGLILIGIAYGIPLTQYTLSIDEEKAMFSTTVDKDWGEQGRFGIVLLKMIFFNWHSNSITSTFLAIVCLFFSSILGAFIFSFFSNETRINGKNSLGYIFIFLFITFPFHSENIGFAMMSFELYVGWILVLLSFFFICSTILLRKSSLYFVLGVVLLTFSISIYQSFLFVYVGGVFSATFLFLLSSEMNAIKQTNLYYVYLKYFFGVVLAYGLYFFINFIVELYYPSTGYVDNFMVWGKSDFKEIVGNLLAYFSGIFLGRSAHGGIIITISYCIGLISCMLLLISLLRKRYMIRTFITFIGVLFTPLLMPILLGSAVPIRTSLTWALVIPVIWMGLNILIKSKYLKVIVFLVLIIFAVSQALALSRLFYGDYMRYQNDVRLANQIGAVISNLNQGEDPSLPVLFVGKYPQKQDENVIKQEVLGYSFYEWDGSETKRIRLFMKSLGYDYISPTEQQRKIGNEAAVNMPAWPYKGSVAIKNDIIIVNLSENQEKYKLSIIQESDKVRSAVAGSQVSYDLLRDRKEVGVFDMNVLHEDTNSVTYKAGSYDPQVSFVLSQPMKSNDYKFIEMEFISDVDGEGYLFFAQENEQYSGKFSTNMMVKKGLNRIVVKKQVLMNNIGSLRIDPPNNANFTIEKIHFY
ncbi:glucosyltransferase domain-containing protein [Paenibacillus amylolyticus]|uniref:glucosyltransferase domain-containing protein n=1 Tax=Paenibacillus amylolyticus TaxID=1451 RepID=UPI003D99CBE0